MAGPCAPRHSCSSTTFADQGHPHSNCIEASFRWTRPRTWRKPARILYVVLVRTRIRLTANLATNQYASSCDRTNVCMYHLDHLLQLPWAQHRRQPPTETARLKRVIPKIRVNAALAPSQAYT